MPLFLQLARALAMLITAAKLGGYLSLRLGQPAVLGELLAGLILGPSLLDLLHWTPFSNIHLGETINCIAELGVLLLMFIAGLAAVGFVVGGIGMVAGWTWWRSIVIGVVAFSTSFFVLFWDGKMRKLDDQGGIALIINIAILAAVLIG